jgi:hypothetical protein
MGKFAKKLRLEFASGACHSSRNGVSSSARNRKSKIQHQGVRRISERENHMGKAA